MGQDPSRIEASWPEEHLCLVRLTESRILDELSIEQIGRELKGLVQDHLGLKVVLSFEGVEYLSSSVLSMLLNLKKTIDDFRGCLKLADICPQIMRVFQITRLAGVFDIAETADQALEELAGGDNSAE